MILNRAILDIEKPSEKKKIGVNILINESAIDLIKTEM